MSSISSLQHRCGLSIGFAQRDSARNNRFCPIPIAAVSTVSSSGSDSQTQRFDRRPEPARSPFAARNVSDHGDDTARKPCARPTRWESWNRRSRSASSPRGTWDAIVVGAGHNGLTCAAYLARSGQQVLVLEARQRVGGACTIDEVWPGYRISPCAYLVGLLPPAGDRRARPAGLRLRVVPRRRRGCSCRSTTAAASSSGTTTSGARRRSAGSRPSTSTAGATSAPSRRGCATPFGPPARATSGSARRPRSRRSTSGSAATTRPGRCSSSGRWSSASRITSRTSGCRWPTSARG